MSHRSGLRVLLMLLLFPLAACTKTQETDTPQAGTEKLLTQALDGQEIETSVDVLPSGEVRVCLTTYHLLRIDGPCNPTTQEEYPLLGGPKVEELASAIPIGGWVRLTLSRAAGGWILDQWEVIRDDCDDDLVRKFKGADRCD